MDEQSIIAAGAQFAHDVLDPMTDDQILEEHGADTGEEAHQKSLELAQMVHDESDKRYAQDINAYSLFRRGYEQVSQERYAKIIDASWDAVMH